MTGRFSLPEERIASWPAGRTGERHTSRLLVAEHNRSIVDREFSEIGAFLRPGDLLVLNDTRVLARRFFLPQFGERSELFLLEEVRSESSSAGIFRALGRPYKKMRGAGRFPIGEGLWAALIADEEPQDGSVHVRLEASGDLREALDRTGVLPIPPYIREGRAEAEDHELYQTVYAQAPGSVAAPTAGLHFTKELLHSLHEQGVIIQTLTHHVGSASFSMVRDPATHRMERERYLIPEPLHQAILDAKRDRRRICCVGTTATRALESYARTPDYSPEFRSTELFIREPFKFEIVDLLITNFHHPESTHILLVEAFLGAARTAEIYRHALAGQYRFLSYGDSMLLERNPEGGRTP